MYQWVCTLLGYEGAHNDVILWICGALLVLALYAVYTAVRGIFHGIKSCIM